MTRDELRAVLEGGKHDEVLKAWLADDKVILQWRYGPNGAWCDYHEVSKIERLMELRIKPKALQYRVALFAYPNCEPYLCFATTELHIKNFPENRNFAHWLGDWQEIEVNHA